jgi:hypothetical protein
MQDSKMTTPEEKPSIANRRVFMMGNGKPVQPKQVDRFCKVVLETLLDGEMYGHYEFVLGFAACFDAVARGTIDLEASPCETIIQAWRDTQNITNKPNKITDIMRVDYE